MRLLRQGKVHLTTMAAVLSLCGCLSDPPANEPMLNVPQKDGTCATYKLIDKTNLKYQFVNFVPCSTYQGGFCLPKGEMEALIAWGRQEIKNCQSQNQQ